MNIRLRKIQKVIAVCWLFIFDWFQVRPIRWSLFGPKAHPWRPLLSPTRYSRRRLQASRHLSSIKISTADCEANFLSHSSVHCTSISGEAKPHRESDGDETDGDKQLEDVRRIQQAVQALQPHAGLLNDLPHLLPSLPSFSFPQVPCKSVARPITVIYCLFPPIDYDDDDLLRSPL